MKHTILIIAALMLALCTTAQPPRGKFKPEEFKAKLEAYVTNEAGFTPGEAQAFYPIFHEMKGKQLELQRQIFRLKRNAPAGDADDKDYASVIQKINALNVESAQLEQTYYKRMCKAVPARKVYRAMRAEDKFHREMLGEYNHHRPKRK